MGGVGALSVYLACILPEVMPSIGNLETKTHLEERASVRERDLYD